VMWIFGIPCALDTVPLNGVTNQIQLVFSVTLILRFMFVTSGGLKRLRVRPQSRQPRYYLKYIILTENRHYMAKGKSRRIKNLISPVIYLKAIQNLHS
jgi:hypothetical protein